ncbi:uncharacterized protein STAUR_0152 [Stigmatella aurantiaca DW4/3-1]|uniref:Uncharacterized protein n=1 Tax=Stigmatella aurantiaca (strain DW4/3-1) TaxID=378806 RepID=E3FKI8_STIAD|nr:uncharacterized protein STAUR_0152 [Stigmatella aurantiaca DW4/3-1]
MPTAPSDARGTSSMFDLTRRASGSSVSTAPRSISAIKPASITILSKRTPRKDFAWRWKTDDWPTARAALLLVPVTAMCRVLDSRDSMTLR